MDKRSELLKLAAAKIIVNNTRPQMRATNEVVKLAAAKILRHRFPELKKIAIIRGLTGPGEDIFPYGTPAPTPQQAAATFPTPWMNPPNTARNGFTYQLGRFFGSENAPPVARWGTQRAANSAIDNLVLGGKANTAQREAIKAKMRSDPKLMMQLKRSRDAQQYAKRMAEWSVSNLSPTQQAVLNQSVNKAGGGIGAATKNFKNQTLLNKFTNSKIYNSPFGKTMKGLGIAGALAGTILPLLSGKGAFGIRALGGKSREDEMYDRQMKQYERAMQMAQMGQMAQMLGQGGQTFNNALSPMYSMSSQMNPYFNYRPGARQVGR